MRSTIALWLAAITAANLISAKFGPEASMFNAFWLIGLTLVLRDRLHDAWATGRFWKMGLLILTGSLLAYAVTPSAGRIGLASGVAFLCAESVDALVYHAVRRWPWLERSNFSNFFGAVVDSFVFPTVAFGGFVWTITAGQFTAKVAGALLFTLVVQRMRTRVPRSEVEVDSDETDDHAPPSRQDPIGGWPGAPSEGRA